MMNARGRGLLLAFGLLFLLAGCAEHHAEKVTGKVTYRGEPMPNLTVWFVPEEGRPSVGRTDENGLFTLRNDKNHPGADFGHYTVTFSYKPASLDEEAGKIQPKLHKKTKEILEKYRDAKKSDLHFDITANGQFINIELQ